MNNQRLITLNDSWLLIDGNTNDDPNFHINGIPAENAVITNLPAYVHMYIKNHVGIAWHEKKFELSSLPSENEIALLCFEQAVFRTEVSVNGKPAGVHVGAEDPFCFDVTGLLKQGENRITVRTSKPHVIPVDGYTFDEVPHRNQTPTGLLPGNCYNESGLSGEVTLKIIPRVYIDDLYLSPNVESGEIEIELTAINASSSAVKAGLSLDAGLSPCGEKEVNSETEIELSPGENLIKMALKIASPRLWDTAEPNLYSVRAELSSSFGEHTATKRCGFRTFAVGEDGYFYLNGRRILLRCSHTGNAMPESTHHISRDRELLRKDFLLAKSTGFNTIRFISGAALPIQLDLCDEIGLMIYVEPLASWKTLNGPHAVENYRHDLLSMIKRDRSHPCITIWGLLNEHPCTEPFNQVFEAAKNSLPSVRELDNSRLVILSSGRWDALANIGSLCNPGKSEWEFLWGKDGDADHTEGDLGDIHFYPYTIPLRKDTCNRMRTFGSKGNKPVFVSETGVGSALDTVSILRYYDRPDTIDIAPDIQIYKQMNDQLLEDIERYGFSDCIPFTSSLMDKSMENHAYYREQGFDQLRSNPKICGISLTGLLDHSTCGEGLWTIYRTLKPRIADVLQDGFAPLRWCVFPSAPAVFRGSRIGFEASLASEDVLIAGKIYNAVAGILDENGSPVDVRKYSFTPSEEEVRTMVVPVFDEEWETKDLPIGEYTFKVELLNGGLASCGVKKFHVLPAATSKTNRKICSVALTERHNEFLASLGYEVCDLSDYTPDSIILCGTLSSEQAQGLTAMVENGATVVAACGAFDNDFSHEIIPPSRRPEVNRDGDWLYHRESFLRPGDKFFEGMRTGLCDALLFTNVIKGTHYVGRDASVPDDTHAFAFETGFPGGSGYIGGFKLATYNVGKGKLILNTYDLFDSAFFAPYSRQLLVNLLDKA
ncbi:MAG: hypothetical protein IKM29_01060 [Clostridia bacterium]|nr:hypothetical protein [Clostridia bacterium]